MMADAFFSEDFRVLTPEAFDFVLGNELKRAVRSQNFLTLVLLDATPRAADTEGVRDRAVHELTRLVSRDVRETDLLCHSDKGRLSVVLLDADLLNSMRVIDRLMARLDHYEFEHPIAIEVGAACCPTHGVDPDSLRRAAEARSLYHRAGRHGSASNE